MVFSLTVFLFLFYFFVLIHPVGRILPLVSREDLQDTEGTGGEAADEVAETGYDAHSAWNAFYWYAAGSPCVGAARTTNRTTPK